MEAKFSNLKLTGREFRLPAQIHSSRWLIEGFGLYSGQLLTAPTIRQEEIEMRISKFRAFLGVTLSILCLLIITTAANAQAINATIGDILSNPDQYDGKMVQVGGWVSSPQFNASRVGPYTTFNLGDKSGKALSVFRLGILSIKEGDFVRVTLRYKHSDRLLWIYSIEGPGN